MGRNVRVSTMALFSAFAVMGFSSCNDDDDEPIVDTISEQDRNFAIAAAQTNNAEIAMGELALEKGVDDSVLEYAGTLVSEHSAAKSELVGIVQGRDIEITDDMTDAMKAKYDALLELEGEEFDMGFINAQLENTENAQTIYENQMNNGENYLLKQYAEKTRNLIREHRGKAVLVKAELEIEGI